MVSQAKNFFAERSSYQINGKEAQSRPYGSGSATTSGNRSVMVFDVRNGFRVRVSINSRNGRYSASLSVPSRYVGGATATGTCARR